MTDMRSMLRKRKKSTRAGSPRARVHTGGEAAAAEKVFKEQLFSAEHGGDAVAYHRAVWVPRPSGEWHDGQPCSATLQLKFGSSFVFGEMPAQPNKFCFLYLDCSGAMLAEKRGTWAIKKNAFSNRTDIELSITQHRELSHGRVRPRTAGTESARLENGKLKWVGRACEDTDWSQVYRVSAPLPRPTRRTAITPRRAARTTASPAPYGARA